MTIERKVGMGIAGQPTGGATDVADVFSTYLYDGVATGQMYVQNGIDLASEGGMVWIKSRGATYNNYIFSTDFPTPSQNYLVTNTTTGIASAGLNFSFETDGFKVDGNNGIAYNGAGYGPPYVSWTFRKKEKFFDVVTVTTGNSTNTRHSHNLGSVPGLIIGKNLNGTGQWYSYHRSLGRNKHVRLNGANAASTSTDIWGTSDPTDTDFGVNDSGSGFGNMGDMVYYLFADNSTEDAEDQMIKCGSFTGNGSATGPVVNLGWEPQFLITKVVNSNNWHMWDSMRGIVAGTGDARLYPNLDNVEDVSTKLQLTPTGFQIKSSSGSINTSGVETIYMAIRAPMMIEPEAATDVFGITTRNVANDSVAPEFRGTFPVDMALRKWDTSDPTQIVSRLTQGRYLTTNSQNTEQASSTAQFDYNNGWSSSATGANTDLHSWMWKRAKGYMDVVAYTGDGQQGKTVAHSLGVVPEMMWVKLRDQQAYSWAVYSKDLSINQYLVLDTTAAPATNSLIWDGTQPTNSVFSTGDTGYWNNANTKSYIAYLFATLAGISKVGSYTGNGSNQTIDCGFSAGSRFILIKRTDATGSWYVWDSVRGIVAGNDPHFSLHTNNGDITTDDSVDPANSGFIVNQNSATDINVSSGTYIFYAIA